MLRRFSWLLLLFGFALLIKTSNSNYIRNCQNYSQVNSSVTCQQCFGGYTLSSKGNCQTQVWIEIVGFIMYVKNLQPLFSVKSCFIDFVAEYWFFSANQSHSLTSNKLTNIVVALNYQRLWPLKLFQFIKNIIGEDLLQFFIGNIDGNETQLNQKNQNIKISLFHLTQKPFTFTYSCFFHLLCSFLIIIIIYISLSLLQHFIYLLTGAKFLEKKQIKGILILMLTNQFYSFIGFYGFYSLRYSEGSKFFGSKAEIIIILMTIFLFSFISLCGFPLNYYFNLPDRENKKTQRIILRQVNQIHKVHRALTFSYSLTGYLYFMINGYFKQFFIGAIVGFFFKQSFHILLIVFFYVAELLILQSIAENLNSRIYFAFRKGFILIIIGYLLLIFEQAVHLFSDISTSFQEAEELCLCMVYILSVMQFLAKVIQQLSRILKLIVNYIKKKKNKVHNIIFEQKLNEISSGLRKRKTKRVPSITNNILRKLKFIGKI